MKILLVEDDDAVRNTLVDVLNSKKHTVDETASAEEAIVKLPGDYNLVISDVLLKEMDGLTLLDHVNTLKPRIPVVMITGFGGSEVEDTCRKRGAAGFLNKPFSVHRLLSLVEEVGKVNH
jgi:DNA-binding NtrC family response regulator